MNVLKGKGKGKGGGEREYSCVLLFEIKEKHVRAGIENIPKSRKTQQLRTKSNTYVERHETKLDKR